ncbi:MAG: DUF3667 domain-containing protein [Bacteroidota bacterium]
MKYFRRNSECLNCGHPFEDPEAINFCPECGQANTDNRVSLRELWEDLFSNYLNFDTRLGHTIIPLLFKPGKLTKDFLEGKRMHYVHPIKLYLMCSVLFFFTFNHLIMPEGNEQITAFQDKIMQDSTEWISRVRQQNMSEDAFLDSLEVDRQSFIEERAAKKLYKVLRNDASLFVSNVVQNTPLVMLVILPVLALSLSIFYYQKRRFYIEHLVFALHWQTFFYIVLVFAVLLSALGLDTVASTFTLTLFPYSFLMARKVYRDNWFWTIFKLLLVSGFYIVMLIFALIFNALLSFLLF